MVGVARGHQRADTLKPYSQKTSQSNHTRTTALSNSMKLSHACGATQDRQVMVERPDRMWSTGEGNGKPLQYSCLENPMNSILINNYPKCKWVECPNQKTKIGWMDTKTRPLYTLLTRDPPQNKGHIQTKSEGLEKDDIPRKQRPKESRSGNTHIQ